MNPVVKIHSRPGNVVLDSSRGSGTAGEAAARQGRGFVLVDDNPAAVQIAAARLDAFRPEGIGFSPIPSAHASPLS